MDSHDLRWWWRALWPTWWRVSHPVQWYRGTRHHNRVRARRGDVWRLHRVDRFGDTWTYYEDDAYVRHDDGKTVSAKDWNKDYRKGRRR